MKEPKAKWKRENNRKIWNLELDGDLIAFVEASGHKGWYWWSTWGSTPESADIVPGFTKAKRAAEDAVKRETE